MTRLIIIALAFISGSVALSHELLWTRRLVDLLGASDWVTGRVLGLFFLGLAIGGWIASGWTQRDSNAAFRLGAIEFLIAVLSLPAVFLPYWADWIIASAGADFLVSWQGKSLKLLLSGLVVMPPAIAMGTTMPLFIHISTRFGGSVERTGILIYSLNMLGGVFGLWLTSTYLLDHYGVRGTMLVAALGNCLIALAAILLARNVASAPATTASEPQRNRNELEATARWQPSRRGIYILAFVSGAFVLALEVLVLRLMALVAPSSFHTTSALLANVILFLSLGAFGVALLNRFRISKVWQLIAGFGGAALSCAACPLILYYYTNELVSLRYLQSLTGNTTDSLTQYWFLLFCTIAVAAGVTLLCSGLIFPSILSMSSRSDPQGKLIGRILAVNGIGGLLGCELANSVLVSQFGIYGGFVVLAFVVGATALVICFYAKASIAGISLVVATLGFVAITLQPFGALRYISPNTKKKFVIEESRFGPEGSLLVTRDITDSRSMLLNNQYILGGSSHATVERRQLLLPWMLNQKAKDVCVLGLATGISASGLEVLENPPRVTAVELSETVADLARDSFAKENLSFFKRPGNRIVCEDGRTFIAATEDEFDLIVADLFRPHGSGEGRLFSVEHYRNVHRALKDDGLFCHWLPAHQLNEEQFRMIAATFMRVFPETLVINGSSLSRTPSIGLCGWKDGRKWKNDDLLQNIKDIRKQKDVSDKMVRNAHLLVNGTLSADQFADVSINTLDNASLELNAGRFWLLKDLRSNRPADDLSNGFLSGANWKKFLTKLHEQTTHVLDSRFREQYLQLLH